MRYRVPLPFLYDSLGRFIHVLGSPIVILGGLLGALAINLWPVTRLSLTREDQLVTGSVAVRLSAGNLAVVGLAGTLLVVILVYLVLENLHHMPG